MRPLEKTLDFYTEGAEKYASELEARVDALDTALGAVERAKKYVTKDTIGERDAGRIKRTLTETSRELLAMRRALTEAIGSVRSGAPNVARHLEVAKRGFEQAMDPMFGDLDERERKIRLGVAPALGSAKVGTAGMVRVIEDLIAAGSAKQSTRGGQSSAGGSAAGAWSSKTLEDWLNDDMEWDDVPGAIVDNPDVQKPQQPMALRRWGSFQLREWLSTGGRVPTGRVEQVMGAQTERAFAAAITAAGVKPGSALWREAVARYRLSKMPADRPTMSEEEAAVDDILRALGKKVSIAEWTALLRGGKASDVSNLCRIAGFKQGSAETALVEKVWREHRENPVVSFYEEETGPTI